jgi:hypothetical protein
LSAVLANWAFAQANPNPAVANLKRLVVNFGAHTDYGAGGQANMNNIACSNWA